MTFANRYPYILMNEMYGMIAAMKSCYSMTPVPKSLYFIDRSCVRWLLWSRLNINVLCYKQDAPREQYASNVLY